MLDGVTIEKPETVTVDAEVKVGIDTVIGPFARITGSHCHRRELPHRRLFDRA
jgi:bifunctional N-acetylglucosamine-1-phosphate-uridyltransferase/glucosamine-1-phosphate-acetyltransferase GlmU-like protein